MRRLVIEGGLWSKLHFSVFSMHERRIYKPRSDFVTCGTAWYWILFISLVGMLLVVNHCHYPQI